MNLMVSAQGGDVTSWRAVEHFAAVYRQALLDLAVSGRSGSAETVFIQTAGTLDKVIASHKMLLQEMERLTENLPETAAGGRKELTASFYQLLYRHFEKFRSAHSFYQQSMSFLEKASAAIVADATAKLGDSARTLPEIALIALGPAGRGEYSPYCQLQLLLVHGYTADLQTVALFCNLLHSGFEDAGLPVDPVITPRNPEWRGSLTEWRHRCYKRVASEDKEELINLCRLVDLYPLHHTDGFDVELKHTWTVALNGSYTAEANLIERMAALSNGLGLMGRLKLERSGKDRGLFRLLDHGLLPLSAALSTLALIKRSVAVTSCERIRELLKRGELDVELADRMMATWHTLHGLRLWHEHTYSLGADSSRLLCLNPSELTVEQRHSLTEALESVATVQRHVKIIFSGMEE